MQELRDKANLVADKYGIPRELFARLIDAESSWRPHAKSNKGAIGLTQVMPATARDMGYDPKKLAKDVDMQLEAGAKYLSRQYRSFGDWSTALWAYNAGPGNARGGVKPQETIDYIAKIMGSGSAALFKPTEFSADVFNERKTALDRSLGAIRQLFRPAREPAPLIERMAPYTEDRAPSLRALLDAIRGVEQPPMLPTFAEYDSQPPPTRLSDWWNYG